MRLFHQTKNKTLHSVAGVTSLKFLSIDFGINTKALLPTMVSLHDATPDTPSTFICVDCNETISPEELFTKCCVCGKMFPISELLYLSKTGIVVCKTDLEKEKDVKETSRSLLTISQNISIK